MCYIPVHSFLKRVPSLFLPLKHATSSLHEAGSCWGTLEPSLRDVWAISCKRVPSTRPWCCATRGFKTEGRTVLFIPVLPSRVVLCTEGSVSLWDQEMSLMLLKFMEWNSSRTLKDPEALTCRRMSCSIRPLPQGFPA